MKSISGWRRISFGIGFSRGPPPPPAENIKKKSPCLRTGSHLEYGGEGGIDSLRSPLLGPSMGLALRGQRRRCSKTLPAFFCRGSPLTACAVCPTGCASCRTPVGGSHPPGGEYKEKSPYLRTGSHLEYGGEGGLTRFARRYSAHPWASPPAGPTQALFKNAPGVFCRGSPLTACAVCPTGCASCRTPVGVLIPPCGEYKEKSPYFRTGSHLEYGGEGGFEPRYVAVYTLSRRAPSATRTPHHIVFPVVVGNGR